MIKLYVTKFKIPDYIRKRCQPFLLRNVQPYTGANHEENKTSTSDQGKIDKKSTLETTTPGQNDTIFLTESDLAQRWSVSVKLLQKLRCSGDGIPFVRIGKRAIRYDRRDVILHESNRRRQNTSEEG